MKLKNNLYFLFFSLIFVSEIYHINLLSIDPYLNKVIDFSESTDTISNPGMGFTTTYWHVARPNVVKVSNLSGSLVLMFIDIGAYSSGINEEQVDYDLDSAFFESLQKLFENCRKNGATIALRFRYDANGKSNPEPKTFDQVLKHISQIKNSGLLEEYKDILMFVESGFVGAWGEQHSGKYCSLEYKAQLLDTLLNAVPDNIPITVRTPNIIAKWLNIPEDKLDTFVSEKGSRESRVGLFNDGYMGSDSDLGTYRYRENSVNFFYNQMRYTYFGGEFSGNINFALKYDTYKPENSIREMYKTHLSYINSNIFQLYKNYTFSKEYDVENVDNSAYYGQTVFKFIRDHIGYRLVLRDSFVQKEIMQGGIFEARFTLENTGFANPIFKMNSEIILEKNGQFMKTEVEVDSTELYSCSKKTIELKIKIPGEIETGIWNVFFKLYIGKTDSKTYYMRSVRFANKDIYDPSLGANFLGNINIVKSPDKTISADKTFYQFSSSSKKENFQLYTNKGIIRVDGEEGIYEWSEDFLLKESNGLKIYAANDDQFLYVMANIKHNSKNPAINIQIVNTNDNKRYWLYYLNNGFVYFSEKNYENWLFKHSDNIFEFKVPFGEVMNMNCGTKLKSIRVSIQDVDNSWANVGDITSGEYIINYNLFIYTSFRNVTLKSGENFVINLDLSADNTSYQWLLNGEKIEKANKKSYEIKNANKNNIGVYSVRISGENGDKIIDICKVNDVI